MALVSSLNSFNPFNRMKACETVPQYQPRHKIVMVVDDDDTFRLILCDRLEQKGLKCVEAENGKVAISQLKKNQVDLIITDYRMPIMDGIELIEWLQRNRIHLPIILISGDLNESTRVHAEQANVYAILEKPCSLSELSLKVKEALGEP